MPGQQSPAVRGHVEDAVRLEPLVGLLTASAVHVARMSLRPVVTGLTAGLGNGPVSLIEDLLSFVLAVLAVLAPLLGLLLLLVGGLLLFSVARRSVRWGSGLFTSSRQQR